MPINNRGQANNESEFLLRYDQEYEITKVFTGDDGRMHVRYKLLGGGMLNMVFDFNAWNKKWVACKTGTPMKKYYWEKLKEAQEDFKDDWRMFLEAYNDPTHKMRINYDFLTEKLDEILKGCVYSFRF